MSKMDGLRAMREAKYAAAAKRAGSPGVAPRKPAGAAEPAPPVAPPAPAAEAAPDERLCGHRNMGGRSCTREHGHAAKSHRYS